MARKSTQRVECWDHLEDIKENGKRLGSKCNYYSKIRKAESTKNGTKNFGNYFLKFLENPSNQSK